MKSSFSIARRTLPCPAWHGIDAKLVAAPLVKLPYVLVTRKEVRRLEDLKGKALGVTRPGDLSARLSRAVLKKFNLSDEVMIRPSVAVRMSVSRRWPPMWCKGSLYRRRSMFGPKRGIQRNLPAHRFGSAVHLQFGACKLAHLAGKARTVKESWPLCGSDSTSSRRTPKAQGSISKAMRIKDEEALRVSYNVFAKEIVDRRMTVPAWRWRKAWNLFAAGGTLGGAGRKSFMTIRSSTTLEKSGFSIVAGSSELPK
jgi:hypothetical protein